MLLSLSGGGEFSRPPSRTESNFAFWTGRGGATNGRMREGFLKVVTFSDGLPFFSKFSFTNRPVFSCFPAGLRELHLLPKAAIQWHTDLSDVYFQEAW